MLKHGLWIFAFAMMAAAPMGCTSPEDAAVEACKQSCEDNNTDSTVISQCKKSCEGN